MDVIVSKNSKIFHRVRCTYVGRMRDDNKITIDYRDALSQGYIPCSCCSKSNSKVKLLKGDGFNSMWDKKRDAWCIRTDVGFWRSVLDSDTNDWILYHMNNNGTKHFDPNLSDEELMNGAFHRQVDVLPTTNVENIVRYIGGHEHSIRVKRGDYRNLPKKWRHQEKNRKRRRGLREVRKLLKRLDKEKK